MRFVLIIALAFLEVHSFGQNFQKKFTMAAPVALQDSKVQWVDANNDSLLDVVVASSAQGEVRLTFLKNLGNDSLKLMQTISSGYQTGRFFFTDYNNDNKIDFVISGINTAGIDQTDVFFNAGDFNFQKNQNRMLDKAFAEILMADLNNDGQKDLVAGDANFLYIYEQSQGQFVLRKDTALHASSIKSFDFDGNVFHDIAFSGLTSSNKPTTAMLLVGSNFKILRKVQIAGTSGGLEIGDLNHDGFFDMAISGKDSTGLFVNAAFQNHDTTFVMTKKFSPIDSASVRIADFTSDGKADIAFFGKTGNGWRNWIKTFTGDSVSLPVVNVQEQDYGDYDRDGDLDLVQLRRDSIIVLTNAMNIVNKGPSVVVNPLGVQIYDRMFFYWKKTLDDHTDSTAVTYDLKVYQNGTAIIAPEYDAKCDQRLLPSHGNMGTANYSLQEITGNYKFEIQSIDNSFTVQKIAYGTCSVCANITSQHITLCHPEVPVVLKPNAPKAMWFSFNNGFLGVQDSLTYHKSESDTIFSFNPSSSPSCSNIKLFSITASSEDTTRLTTNIWNCEGSQNLLKVNSEWQKVAWKNDLGATTSYGNQLTVVLQKPVVFEATANNKQGCQLKETFNLKVSKPDLKVENTQYQIAKGSSVQLNASGGNSYSWSPGSTLNDDTICCPLATPNMTTYYTVVAKDSLGCAAAAKIAVEVMESGFIPTLFTPNGDGKNDELKIFGLTSASNFRFTIYNREGNIVFDTKDAAVANNQGWSGLSNGQPQPPGTYYWKVEGSNNSGETLTLNGKKSGAFLLVR